MKRLLTGVLSFLLVAVCLGYLFKDQLIDAAKDRITADMYVAEDADDFDPGLAIGEKVPSIRAVYKGAEINSLSQFARDKGVIFIANRSASW